MDELHIPYSLKNIPIPPRFQYKKQLVKKLESFITRIRWKLFHIRNPTHQKPLPTYGFKTPHCPPQMAELKQFEDDLLNLVANLKFKPNRNQFQDQLRADKEVILSTTDVIVQADKSTNLYRMSTEQYKKKMRETITKDYRKCSISDVDRCTREAATIARELNLEDRIDVPTEDEAFITIKDHKDGFPGRVECRLINPAKDHIGVISKSILDRINTHLRKSTNSNQWLNTNSAIEWFKSIADKPRKTFFKFDIVSFYPSITEKLLRTAITRASEFTAVTAREVNIIMHCRKTLLYFEDVCWTKKDNPSFDVSMGSLDSAEVCELVGLFLLSSMEHLIPQQQLGLYRDDGLAVVDLPGPQIEKLRKKVIKLFASHSLKITTDVNIKSTDFLDTMFNLETGSFKPYRKSSNNPLYIHKQSNHPPHIKTELPKMVARRISDLSSTKEIFSSESAAYNTALKTAGYDVKLQFQEKTSMGKKRARKRNILWFNPPWNDELSTNIARRFLSMVDHHFPRGSELSRYFNRNSIKISYSTMPNMSKIISSHNRKVIDSTKTHAPEPGCNCRAKQDCVLAGKCQSTDIIYKGTVETANTALEYIGLTSTSFKQRYANHKASFKHKNKSSETTLSRHIWKLKDNGVPFKTTWSIMANAPSYNKKIRSCQLCLMEKTFICTADPKKTLNKRSEIISKCRHRDKLLLKHW